MTRARVAAFVFVAAALVVGHRFGLFARFSDPVSIKRSLLGLGLGGQVAFVGAYTVLQPFGVPGTVFVLAAPLIWPWPVAFALSMTGTMTASVVGFSFARFVARDFAQERVFARLGRYQDALERRSFLTVFLLRLVFWMPQWLHVLLGVSKVSFSTHFWASLAGYALPLFLVSYFGEPLFNWLRTLPAAAWVAMAASLGAIGFAVWYTERRRRR